jgi:hypothetical protein
MIRVAFFIPWLAVFLALGLGTIRRSEGVEIFRVAPRVGEPGVFWSVTGSVWYSKRNPFPEVRSPGGNFFITVQGDWVTASNAGTLHLQPLRTPIPAAVGGNFLIDSVTGRILGVDEWGYPVDTLADARNWRALGWNWLITQEGVLITLRKSGVAPGNGVGMLTRKTGWNFSDVVSVGGAFFICSDGRVVTISEVTGYFKEWSPIISGIRFVGGRFLIDGESHLWTVDEDGALIRTDRVVSVHPRIHGNAWMGFPDGIVWNIDRQGRVVDEVMLVKGAGQIPVRSNHFFEKFDTGSVFRATLKEMDDVVN